VRVEGEIEVQAPIEDVWGVFMNPSRLCDVMPGCDQATQIDATHYEATMAIKVQFMTIRARATGELLEVEVPRHLVASVVGETFVMAGAFRATLTVDLTSEGDSTWVRYAFDLTMLGRLGSLGEPIVRSTARKVATQFAANLSELFNSTGKE
jgi:carbon monoxide dehydrogenase subunit G